jgi:hypothetical protein
MAAVAILTPLFAMLLVAALPDLRLVLTGIGRQNC